jgi:predicted flap endonuclease-1-like 5' DNA nuclease/uncharacterized coiled-coil protein SlyX
MTAASSMNERLLDDSVDDSTRNRKSGIVDALESMPSAVPPHRDVDIDITTDDGAEPHVLASASSNGVAGSVASGNAVSSNGVSGNGISGNGISGNGVSGSAVSGNGAGSAVSGNGVSGNGVHAPAEASGVSRISIVAASTSGDDDAIEVSDDEIETAELPAYRAPMPSLLGLSRSVPPAPPSSRPRPRSSASSLPPPRSSRPSYDPWALANKTLELKHANTYIAELQELVAFRDARIAELEDNLAKARHRLEDLERRLADLTSRELDIDVTPASVPTMAPPSSPKSATLPAAALQSRSAARELEIPTVTETRPALVLPMPSDDARGVASRERSVEDDADGGEELTSEHDPSGGERVTIARSGSEDDLQQITGIGPRFEAALRKQGITRLSQIAAWSEADVRQVAKALKIPKSRIVKGRWVEVAREVIGMRAASE